LGAAVKRDDKGDVIVVQVRDGNATDATAKLLVGMQSLKDLQLSGEALPDCEVLSGFTDAMS
jgi:ATP-dependent DNA ligase